MALLDRLEGTEQKIAVHAFQAALHEWDDGAVTRAQIVTAFNLSAEDQVQLDDLAALFSAAANKVKFAKVLDNSLLLLEAGHYGQQTVIDRLQAVSAEA